MASAELLAWSKGMEPADPPIDRDVWQRWADATTSEERAALRIEIAERHVDLLNRAVASVRKRFASTERDELMAWAILGLYDAMTRFDPAQGVPFEGFAYPRVRGSIIDNWRRSRLSSRDLTVSGLSQFQLDALRAADSGDRPEERAALASDLAALNVALVNLDWKQRTAVVMRYLEEVPIPEIAQVLRLDPSRVRHLCAEALTQLRSAVGN